MAGGALPAAHGASPVPLEQVVAEALRSNPELQAAEREREAARQRIAPAGALEDPMLEVGAANLPASSWRFDRDEMTMKMIGVTQRFPAPGKRALRQEVAARDAEAVGYGYQETGNRVAREAKLAYWDLSFVIESARIVERNKRILEQFARVAEARYAVGQAQQSDVLKAQTQLSRMLDELLRLARERAGLEAELRRVLGRSPQATTPLPEAPRLQDAPLAAESLRAAALASRPQLLALQSLVARNERAIALARRDYDPDIDVRLAYAQRGRVDGMRLDDMVNVTVAVNLPVWRATKLAPRVAEAIAMREQAQHQYEAQRNELLARLEQQLATAEQSLRSARLYESGILPQARLAVEASLAAYRVDRVDFLTLLDSQMAVLNHELSYLQAQANQRKALAELEWIVGQPLP